MIAAHFQITSITSITTSDISLLFIRFYSSYEYHSIILPLNNGSSCLCRNN